MPPPGPDRAAARRITFELFAAGRASLANAIERVRAAFPDLRHELVHEIADGDVVVHHLAAHGTHTGPLAGAASTGRSAAWREVHVMRFEDGRLAEQWGVVDRLGLLQQLGEVAPG